MATAQRRAAGFIFCLLATGLWIATAWSAPKTPSKPTPSKPTWSATQMTQVAGRFGRFPQVSGTSIARVKRSLPADFPGAVNFVMLGFARAHQKPLQAWLPLLRKWRKTIPGFDYMGMPVLGGFARIFGGLIEGGMRRKYKAPGTQARMMLLYSVQSKLVKSLRIGSTKRLVLLLVDRQGRVFWQGAGGKTTANINALKAAIKALQHHPSKPRPRPSARRK